MGVWYTLAFPLVKNTVKYILLEKLLAVPGMGAHIFESLNTCISF